MKRETSMTDGSLGLDDFTPEMAVGFFHGISTDHEAMGCANVEAALARLIWMALGVRAHREYPESKTDGEDFPAGLCLLADAMAAKALADMLTTLEAFHDHKGKDRFVEHMKARGAQFHKEKQAFEEKYGKATENRARAEAIRQKNGEFDIALGPLPKLQNAS